MFFDGSIAYTQMSQLYFLYFLDITSDAWAKRAMRFGGFMKFMLTNVY